MNDPYDLREDESDKKELLRVDVPIQELSTYEVNREDLVRSNVYFLFDNKTIAGITFYYEDNFKDVF